MDLYVWYRLRCCRFVSFNASSGVIHKSITTKLLERFQVWCLKTYNLKTRKACSSNTIRWCIARQLYRDRDPRECWVIEVAVSTLCRASICTTCQESFWRHSNKLLVHYIGGTINVYHHAVISLHAWRAVAQPAKASQTEVLAEPEKHLFFYLVPGSEEEGNSLYSLLRP